MKPSAYPQQGGLFVLPGKHRGLLKRGNINLLGRPRVKLGGGRYGTVLSTSFGINGREVLVPRIYKGQVHSVQQALAHYQRTGKNLGIFKTARAADRYARQLHRQQQKSVVRQLGER